MIFYVLHILDYVFTVKITFRNFQTAFQNLVRLVQLSYIHYKSVQATVVKQLWNLVHTKYFALLSLLTALPDYSECGWGIPHILLRMWISVPGVAQTHSQLSTVHSEVCAHAHSLSTEREAVSSEYECGRLYQFQATRWRRRRVCFNKPRHVPQLSLKNRTAVRVTVNIRIQNQPVQLLQQFLNLLTS